MTDEDHGCWHVSTNVPGFLPDNPAECYSQYETAVDGLYYAAEEYAQQDDEEHELGQEGLPDEELTPGTTEAHLRALWRDDRPGRREAPHATVEVVLRGNDGSARVFTAAYMPPGQCDHEDCCH